MLVFVVARKTTASHRSMTGNKIIEEKDSEKLFYNRNIRWLKWNQLKSMNYEKCLCVYIPDVQWHS